MTSAVIDQEKFYKLASRILILLSAIVISVSPFAVNGSWFDDSSISTTFWEVQIENISIFQFIWNRNLSWMQVNGRFIPLAVLQIYGLAYWIHDGNLFRFAHVAWMLVHICTFVWLLRRLKLSWTFIALWSLLLIAIFQARNYHDPIASYGFLLQSQGIFLTLALLSLVTWCETSRNKWLVLASILSLVPLLMYEINIVFYPMAFALLLISTHSNQTKMRAVTVLMLPLVAYILVTAYLRSASSVNYTGVQVGSEGMILSTYGKQFLAAFPGVFYFFLWEKVFPASKIFFSFISSPVAWILALVSSYSVFHCVAGSKPVVEAVVPRQKELFIIAFCLIVIVPVFVAISKKYQNELVWGWGYIPVYYSYFGVALILAAMLLWVSNRFRVLRIPITIVVASFITANFLVNRDVIDKMDQLYAEPKKSLQAALESGLLDDLRDGDYLTVKGPTYLNRGFFYHYSGKKINIEGIREDYPVPGAYDYGPRRYLLERQSSFPNRWVVSLGLAYGDGWLPFGATGEGVHSKARWSISDHAVINLQNFGDKPASARIAFDMDTVKPRNIRFKMNGATIENLPSFLSGKPVHVEIALSDIAPGKNSMIIETDTPPESPGGGDPRKFSFVMSNVVFSK